MFIFEIPIDVEFANDIPEIFTFIINYYYF
jgi:hypothetical protein